jgi:hypothetical protein
VVDNEHGGGVLLGRRCELLIRFMNGDVMRWSSKECRFGHRVALVRPTILAQFVTWFAGAYKAF